MRKLIDTKKYLIKNTSNNWHKDIKNRGKKLTISYLKNEQIYKELYKFSRNKQGFGL